VLPVRAADGANVAVVPEYVTLPATAVDPCLTVNVDVLIRDVFIGSLNTAVALLLSATDVALFAGVTDKTVGGVTSDGAAVVKLHI
jgi:hypothetical protein